MILERKLPRGQDVRDRTSIRGELPPAAIAHPLQEGPVRQPARSPGEKPGALLAAAPNEKVTVTENGKRQQVTKREAVIAQLVNKSASAELRATKMLIDMLRDIEKGRSRQRPRKTRSARPTKRWSNSWSPGCARNMCNGCPWAVGRLDGGTRGLGQRTRSKRSGEMTTAETHSPGGYEALLRGRFCQLCAALFPRAQPADPIRAQLASRDHRCDPRNGQQGPAVRGGSGPQWRYPAADYQHAAAPPEVVLCLGRLSGLVSRA